MLRYPHYYNVEQALQARILIRNTKFHVRRNHNSMHSVMMEPTCLQIGIRSPTDVSTRSHEFMRIVGRFRVCILVEKKDKKVR